MLSCLNVKTLKRKGDPLLITTSSDYLVDVQRIKECPYYANGLSPAIFMQWNGKDWIFTGTKTLETLILKKDIASDFSGKVTFGFVKYAGRGRVQAVNLLNPVPGAERNSTCTYEILGCNACGCSYPDKDSSKRHFAKNPACQVTNVVFRWGCYACNRTYNMEQEFVDHHQTNSCNVHCVANGLDAPNWYSRFAFEGHCRAEMFDASQHNLQCMLNTHIGIIRKMSAELKREKSKNAEAQNTIKKLNLVVKH
jgi:hypothetical protein